MTNKTPPCRVNKRVATGPLASPTEPTPHVTPSVADSKLDQAQKRAIMLKLGGLVRELDKAGLLYQFRAPLKQIEQGVEDA